MSSRTRALLLWCAATDRTFEIARHGSAEALVGKCIHCNTALCVGLDGSPLSHATIEHIVPRVHGGGDEIENLAVACARCNGGKGVRLDHRRWDDPTLRAVVATLQSRRKARMRPPLESLQLPPYPRLGSVDRAPSKDRSTAAPAGTGRGRGRGRG